MIARFITSVEPAIDVAQCIGFVRGYGSVSK